MEQLNVKSRYVKVIVFSSVNQINNIENKINMVSSAIAKTGGKIVSIIPHSWGISPMNLIYDIIYESDKILSDEDLMKVGENK